MDDTSEPAYGTREYFLDAHGWDLASDLDATLSYAKSRLQAEAPEDAEVAEIEKRLAHNRKLADGAVAEIMVEDIDTLLAKLRARTSQAEAQAPTAASVLTEDDAWFVKFWRERLVTHDYDANYLARSGVLKFIAIIDRLTAPQPQRMPTREVMVAAIIPALRKGMTDELRDVVNCRMWKEDMILTACRAMKYQNPEDAANKTAEIVAGYVADAMAAILTSPAAEERT